MNQVSKTTTVQHKNCYLMLILAPHTVALHLYTLLNDNENAR